MARRGDGLTNVAKLATNVALLTTLGLGMSSPLAELLFSEYRRRVLGLLLMHPEKSYHVREIARLTGTVAGTLHKELSKLAAAGILIKQTVGNQVLYQADRDGLIFEELSSILRKTSGMADVIREALEPFDKAIVTAFIFGSVAKGEATASSDIDLFVITESVAYSDLMGALADAEVTLGRPVNPSLYSMKDIMMKINEGNAFLTRVMTQPKIWVKGSDDDIEQFR
jgi:predicted nucleotidyltransferase